MGVDSWHAYAGKCTAASVWKWLESYFPLYGFVCDTGPAVRTVAASDSDGSCQHIMVNFACPLSGAKQLMHAFPSQECHLTEKGFRKIEEYTPDEDDPREVKLE